MVKIGLGILALYVLYYAGNIVYDLFLKKEKTDVTDEVQEFSLEDVASDIASSKSVTIEDVENIKTPDSYTNRNLGTNSTEDDSEKIMEDLRAKFESEQDLDFEEENEDEKEEEGLASEGNQKFAEEETQLQESTIKKEAVAENKKTQKSWNQIINDSISHVRVIKNYDGQKVYMSTM